MDDKSYTTCTTGQLTAQLLAHLITRKRQTIPDMYAHSQNEDGPVVVRAQYPTNGYVNVMHYRNTSLARRDCRHNVTTNVQHVHAATQARIFSIDHSHHTPVSAASTGIFTVLCRRMLLFWLCTGPCIFPAPMMLSF